MGCLGGMSKRMSKFVMTWGCRMSYFRTRLQMGSRQCWQKPYPPGWIPRGGLADRDDGCGPLLTIWFCGCLVLPEGVKRSQARHRGEKITETEPCRTDRAYKRVERGNCVKCNKPRSLGRRGVVPEPRSRKCLFVIFGLRVPFRGVTERRKSIHQKTRTLNDLMTPNSLLPENKRCRQRRGRSSQDLALMAASSQGRSAPCIVTCIAEERQATLQSSTRLTGDAGTSMLEYACPCSRKTS